MLLNIISFIFSTSLFAQVQLDGLQQAAQSSAINAALVAFILILLAGIVLIFREYKISLDNFKDSSENHAKKLEDIRKEYVEKFEKLQNEYLKREEERNKQWSESEKQTLQVLNGVTTILEMGEKMDQNDTRIVLDHLKECESRIIQAINSNK